MTFSILTVFGILVVLTTATCAFDVTLFKHMLHRQYNFYRALHNAPPVHMNRAISASSERWSEVLGTQPNRVCLHHSGRGGENLFFYWAYQPISEAKLADMTVRAFYKEIVFYDFNHPGYRKPAAHFTEMIWRAVTEIGIGMHINVYKRAHGGCHIGSRKPAYGYFVTVQHDPHGNVEGVRNFERNVLRVRRHKFVRRV